MMILHRIAGFTGLAAALLFAVTPVLAGDYATDSGAKFTRGLANTTTGWGEIPKPAKPEPKREIVYTHMA